MLSPGDTISTETVDAMGYDKNGGEKSKRVETR